ncbi:helix-turn-helix domain-containing protein [Mycolicibacterium mageritense]
MAEVIRRRLLTGAPVPGWMRNLHHQLNASVDGPKTAVAQPQSNTAIDTEEAASILGCSTRHVRRLAADLDGQRVAGRWIFHRHNVIEYAEGKNQ